MTGLPLVNQLRFTRREMARCIDGLSEEEGARRFLPMNCISWMVGHLANQEARYWVSFAQGDSTFAWLNELVGYGKPASTPSLTEMRSVWAAVQSRADAYLDTLTPEKAMEVLKREGRLVDETVGTLLQRNLYHYWFHTGEAYAVRQLLGHTGLPDFVGSTYGYSYQPEGGRVE